MKSFANLQYFTAKRNLTNDWKRWEYSQYETSEHPFPTSIVLRMSVIYGNAQEPFIS